MCIYIYIKVAPANSWWCACLIPWRTCSLHSVWPSRAQAQVHLREHPRNKAKRDLSTAMPPALTVKRARITQSSAPGSASSGIAPAVSSTARIPKRVALAQLDQQIATRRLLAKMPKLAAKCSHLVQTPKDAEEEKHTQPHSILRFKFLHAPRHGVASPV